METKTFKINENEYQFINESWDSRSAWGHKSTLLRNGEEISSCRARYYNRTWESYQYKSVMTGCVYDLIDEVEKEAVQSYKAANNIKRLSKAVREDIESSAVGTVELHLLLSKI